MVLGDLYSLKEPNERTLIQAEFLTRMCQKSREAKQRLVSRVGMTTLEPENGEEIMTSNTIREQILAALRHPEAEDGLYFNNLIVVHEEEERPIVEGHENDIQAVLDSMISEGVLSVVGEGTQRIYAISV
jgi:hypothetical protein